MRISLRKVAALSAGLWPIRNEVHCLLGRIEFVPPDHFLAQNARFAEGSRSLRVLYTRRLAEQPLELFVKKLADEFRRVPHRRPAFVQNLYAVRMIDRK